MSSSSIDVTGESVHRDSSVGSHIHNIGIYLGVLMVLIVIAYLFYYIYKCLKSSESRRHSISPSNRGRRWRRNSITSRDTTFITGSDYGSDSRDIINGIDEATIQAFPSFLYSEANNKKGSSGPSGCSICLQEYMESDSNRLLPECGHYFHLNCIDTWLRIHPTCPICRNPPVQSPVNNPPAAH